MTTSPDSNPYESSAATNVISHSANASPRWPVVIVACAAIYYLLSALTLPFVNRIWFGEMPPLAIIQLPKSFLKSVVHDVLMSAAHNAMRVRQVAVRRSLDRGIYSRSLVVERYPVAHGRSNCGRPRFGDFCRSFLPERTFAARRSESGMQRGKTKRRAVISGNMILGWKLIWSQVAAGLRSPFRQKEPASAHTFHKWKWESIVLSTRWAVPAIESHPHFQRPAASE